MSGEPQQGQQAGNQATTPTFLRRFARPLLVVAGLAVAVAVAVLLFLFAGHNDLGLPGAPGVVKVEIPVKPLFTTRRIIHVRDYPFPRAKDQGTAPSEKQLRDMETVQAEEMELLRWLAASFQLRCAYVGGLTFEGARAFRVEVIKVLHEEQNEIAVLRGREKGKGAAARIEAHRRRELALGAGGRLMLSSTLADVYALDDDESLADVEKGKADEQTLRSRADTVVRNALRGGEPVVVLVLDAGLDLSEAVRDLDPNCGYLRVTTRHVRDLLAGR